MPFRGAIRHELGSNSRLSPAEISCYRMTIIIKGSVKLRINVSITISILGNTIEYSYREFLRGVDQVIADVKDCCLRAGVRARPADYACRHVFKPGTKAQLTTSSPLDRRRRPVDARRPICGRRLAGKILLLKRLGE
jgi:hypothetical protein